MKAPKTLITYCPKCKKHTEHLVTLYKKGKDRSLASGNRRHERERHGYGGQKFPEQKKFAKTTKKQMLKLRCKVCNYTLQRYGIRLKKLEIAA